MIEVTPIFISHIDDRTGYTYYQIEIKDLDELKYDEPIELYNSRLKLDEIDTLIKTLLKFRIEHEKEKTS